MVKTLQSLSFLVFILFSFFNLNAQVERVNYYKQELNKNTILPVEVVPNAINGPEKRVVTFKENSISTNLQSTTTNIQSSTDQSEKKNRDNFTSAKKDETDNTHKKRTTIIETDNVTDELMNTNIYPDLKVVATKVEYNEVPISLKEQIHEQINSVNSESFENEFIKNSTNSKTQITISPLKRKYLEGVILELEDEIKDKKLSKDIIIAKKKELEDLRQLLMK